MKINLVMMRMMGIVLVVSCVLGGGQVLRAQSPERVEPRSGGYSELWGKEGEKWTPQSKLPDFSFSGYHFGEDPIPDVKVVTDVTKFGAKGDGKTDCTEAFRKAIEATDKGAIYIPEGRYVITGKVKIHKSNIVLRGAGPEKTVIYCPKSLRDIKPNDENGNRIHYAYFYAFFEAGVEYSHIKHFAGFGKDTESVLLDKVTESAKRGDVTLTLSKAPKLKTGQLVKLKIKNHAELGWMLGEPGKTTRGEFPYYLHWIARVESVKGNSVTLDRPLRVDVRKEWEPELYIFTPAVSEVGIEHLSIEFSGKPYAGHNKDDGFNAIFFFKATHSWVRNVHITDADTGVCFRHCAFSEMADIVLGSKIRQGGGHHGLWLGGGQECMVRDFKLNLSNIHDLTIEHFCQGNVFKNGSGQVMSFDHHCNVPYDTLYCNIKMKNTWNIWKCGGNASSRGRGKNAGIRSTFWNISWEKGPAKISPWRESIWVSPTDAPPLAQPDPQKRWVENIKDVLPTDLHQAQLDRRLKRGKKEK